MPVYWTDREKEQLRTLWARGVSNKEMGVLLNKHISSIAKMGARLGLPTRQGRVVIHRVPISLPKDVFDKVRADAKAQHLTVTRHLRNLIERNYQQ